MLVRVRPTHRGGSRVIMDKSVQQRTQAEIKAELLDRARLKAEAQERRVAEAERRASGGTDEWEENHDCLEGFSFAAMAAGEGEAEEEEEDDEAEEGRGDFEAAFADLEFEYRPDMLARVIGGIERASEVLAEPLSHEQATIALEEALKIAGRPGVQGAKAEDFQHVRPPPPEAYPDGPPTLSAQIPAGRRAPKPTPAVGDIVRLVWTPGTSRTEAYIASVLPRRSSLLRRSSLYSHKPQLLCTNLDLVLLVVSVEPNFSEGMVDRVLVSAHAQGLEVAIVLNKADLLVEGTEERDEVEERLRVYERIGYRVIYTSTLTEEGLDELKELLSGRMSIFIGNSGVGKSHLLNVLAEGQIALRVGKINEKLKLGRHTTTTTTIHRLPSWKGEESLLIDSPGARRFSIWDVEAPELRDHFVEFLPYAGCCKYRDCQHVKEPNCAVKEAVEADSIPRERWESYVNILGSLRADSEGSQKFSSKQRTAVETARQTPPPMLVLPDQLD